METVICPNVVDVEASGFGSHSYPIEIGIAKSNGERFCTLIKPDKKWQHWSELAQQIHGIPREKLEELGQSPKQTCQALNAFLGDEEVFSDAASHDQHWINKLYSSAKMRPSFKLRAIEYIMEEEQYSVWDDTKQTVAHQLQLIRHRASSDAYLIQQTYMLSRNCSATQPVWKHAANARL